jgi:hypothetical protein
MRLMSTPANGREQRGVLARHSTPKWQRWSASDFGLWLPSGRICERLVRSLTSAYSSRRDCRRRLARVSQAASLRCAAAEAQRAQRQSVARSHVPSAGDSERHKTNLRQALMESSAVLLDGLPLCSYVILCRSSLFFVPVPTKTD